MTSRPKKPSRTSSGTAPQAVTAAASGRRRGSRPCRRRHACRRRRPAARAGRRRGATSPHRRRSGRWGRRRRGWWRRGPGGRAASAGRGRAGRAAGRYATRPKRAGDDRVHDVARRRPAAPHHSRAATTIARRDEGEADAVAPVRRLEVGGAVADAAHGAAGQVRDAHPRVAHRAEREGQAAAAGLGREPWRPACGPQACAARAGSTGLRAGATWHRPTTPWHGSPRWCSGADCWTDVTRHM